MNRGKLSTKVILLAGGIGLSMAAFGGSQSAAAQAYSDESYCPAGIVYYPTYGCTVSGDAYQQQSFSRQFNTVHRRLLGRSLRSTTVTPV